MADDDPDIPKVSNETIDTIRARMLARGNMGVSPDSPQYVDLVVGAILADLVAAVGLDVDELFDFGNVVMRAVFPHTTYGEWLDGWAEALGLERKDAVAAAGTLRFIGPEDTVIPNATTVTTEQVLEDTDPIAFVTTAPAVIPVDGFVDVPAVAETVGAAGNVAAGTVTVPDDDVDGLGGVSNPEPMSAGADVESDDALRARVQLELSGQQGSGTIADYKRWALEDRGVGNATVEPVWDGPGTVRVFVTDVNNDPVPGDVIDRLQERLDPVVGFSEVAPIAIEVTVATPAILAVTVAATIAHEAGYSLVGGGPTQGTQDAIDAAVRRYIDGLDVGADVVRNKLVAAIVDVQGVADVSALTVNGDPDDAVLVVPPGSVASTVAVNLT